MSTNKIVLEVKIVMLDRVKGFEEIDAPTWTWLIESKALKKSMHQHGHGCTWQTLVKMVMHYKIEINAVVADPS